MIRGENAPILAPGLASEGSEPDNRLIENNDQDLLLTPSMSKSSRPRGRPPSSA